MGRFSKVFGALGGAVAGQGLGDPIAALLTPSMGADQAQAVGKIVEILLPLIGVYFAPANRVATPQP